MSRSSIEQQPDMVSEYKCLEETSGRPVPETKSTVHIDPDAALATAKFKKGDIVHLSLRQNGKHTKLSGEVCRVRYNKELDYVEYQLKDALTFALQKNGAFFRERDLKLERAAES